MRNLMRYLAYVFVGLSFGCSDEQSPATVGFRFNTTTTSSTIGGRTEANTLEFTSGTITLDRIQYEVETDDADSVEAEIEQIVVIDFATATTTPDLSELTLPLGTFVSSSVELQLYDDGMEPAVVLEGTFTDQNNVTHPIILEFNSTETFEVEKEGQVVIGEGSSVIAEVTFNPVVWFAGVTPAMLENASRNNNGEIVISETSNTAIFEIVADGLDLATEVEIYMN